MTRLEFGIEMNYIQCAIGVEFRDGQLDVYFDCLGDLPADVFQVAVRRVLMEHRWHTFPSIAELREAAVSVMQGEVTPLSGAEAWELAWRAVGRIDLDVDGSVQRATRNLPPLVVDAMNCLGVANLVGGNDPVPVVRAQFVKAFEQLAQRRQREALLPASTRAAITEMGQREIPAPVRLALAGIGGES